MRNTSNCIRNKPKWIRNKSNPKRNETTWMRNKTNWIRNKYNKQIINKTMWIRNKTTWGYSECWVERVNTRPQSSTDLWKKTKFWENAKPLGIFIDIEWGDAAIPTSMNRVLVFYLLFLKLFEFFYRTFP